MKRIVSVFALGAAFMAGTSFVQAQDKPREAAKEKLVKLDELLDLDQKQEDAVYRMMVAYEINSAPTKEEAKRNSEDLKRDMMKNQYSLMKTMKATLSPEQFEKYKKFRMENMTKEEREVAEMMIKKKQGKSLKSAPGK